MLRTLFMITLLAFAWTPVALAETVSCTNVFHDGNGVSFCFIDAQYGDTPACPGHYDFTGVGAQASGPWGTMQMAAGGDELRCTDGSTNRGIFVYDQTVGPVVFAGWNDGASSDGHAYCWVSRSVGGNGGGLACPVAPPNPGWGHLLP